MTEGKKPGSVYVFVHGMFGWGENEGINRSAPYWGATCGNMVNFLYNHGYESYAASVGPVSGAWDQACELYAQLTGTRVDYGELHSSVYGHRRFGRTYKKPLFEGWSEEKKVHLIGHSFGGNAIRMLVHLLTYGAPQEVEFSGMENVSSLFLGGKESLVYSVTAICSPLNGTGAYEVARKLRLIPLLKNGSLIYAGTLGRTSLNGKLVDFHLEHTGLTNTPGMNDSIPFSKAFKNSLKDGDAIDYDMSPKGSKELNEYIKISENVSYISYQFNAVRKKKHSLPLDTRFPLLFGTSALMIALGKITGDESKKLNDGLVDVASAQHPVNEPFVMYEQGSAIRKGMWNVMPVMQGDHGTPIGLFADKEKTWKLYLDMMKLISSTEKQLAATEK